MRSLLHPFPRRNCISSTAKLYASPLPHYLRPILMIKSRSHRSTHHSLAFRRWLASLNPRLKPRQRRLGRAGCMLVSGMYSPSRARAFLTPMPQIQNQPPIRLPKPPPSPPNSSVVACAMPRPHSFVSTFFYPHWSSARICIVSSCYPSVMIPVSAVQRALSGFSVLFVSLSHYPTPHPPTYVYGIHTFVSA